jgi:hypothetical protein
LRLRGKAVRSRPGSGFNAADAIGVRMRWRKTLPSSPNRKDRSVSATRREPPLTTAIFQAPQMPPGLRVNYGGGICQAFVLPRYSSFDPAAKKLARALHQPEAIRK